MRLLRLPLTRAAQPQLCHAHTVDFGQPARPVIVPLLTPADFDQAGVQRPPQPTFAQEARALIALLRWIVKALLGAFGATTLALVVHYFGQRWRRDFLGAMAPKLQTLPPWSRETAHPRPGHGFGQATFMPDFSTYGFWSTLQLMLEVLFGGRQQEQLWRPGSPLPDNAATALALSTLYRGTAPASPSWTPPELWMISRSHFQWLYAMQPGTVLRSPESWAPFMVHMTLPLATFQQALANAQRTGYFTVSHSDVLGTLDQCLNLALSPRSAHLFYTFQLSIMEQQGVVYTFLPGTEICTFGCRPTQQWLALIFGTQRARMWNRRYVDFLIRLATFEIPMNPSGCTFVPVRHFQPPYALVADLNRYFANRGCRHFRLMHLPVLPEVYRLGAAGGSHAVYFDEAGTALKGHFYFWLSPQLGRCTLMCRRTRHFGTTIRLCRCTSMGRQHVHYELFFSTQLWMLYASSLSPLFSGQLLCCRYEACCRTFAVVAKQSHFSPNPLTSSQLS